VEEQDSTTKEIAQSIRFAARGTDQTMESVEAVSSEITNTSAEAGRVRSASEDIHRVLLELEGSVETFLSDVTKDVEERRAALRVRSQEKVNLLMDGRKVPATLHDVSETGALVETPEQLPVGRPLSLEFRDGQQVNATVVRLDNGSVGLKFAARLKELPLQRAA
jgi:hypothetical protein